jgi:hypothetical protein
MKIQKLFHSLVMLLAAFALLGARPAAANPEDLEAFRGRLLDYVHELQQLPAPVLARLSAEEPLALDAAEQKIRELPSGELRVLQKTLANVPYWTALPRLLAASSQGAGADPETLRSRMLEFVQTLREAAAPLGDGEAQDLGQIQDMIRSLEPQQLFALQAAIAERQPEWVAGLQAADAAVKGGGPGATPVAKAFGCDGGFPGKQICEIEEVLERIEDLPGKVETYAKEAYDDISGELTSLFSTLASQLSWLADPQPADLIAALDSVGAPDLTSPGWWLETAQSIPPVDLPCPAQGIPSIGTLGDLRATYECKRGLEWITRGIHDLAPDDVWGVNVKLVTGALYYPVNYVCLCYEEASSLKADRAQGEHDDLQRARLDTAVSTRASQTHVNGAAAQVSDLDGDVAAVEAKLDSLEATADDLAEQQTGSSAFLLQFQDLLLRLRIEADLYREGNDRISLFQLPKDAGGFLDVVRAVVAAAIDKREEAGADVRHALAELQKADEEQARKAYKSAYTNYRKAYRAAVGSL